MSDLVTVVDDCGRAARLGKSDRRDTLPDRSATGPEALLECLKGALDEIDYGILLLMEGKRVAHFNNAARIELEGHYPLQLVGTELHVRRPQDAMPFYDAIRGAAWRGLRKLVPLNPGGSAVGVSIVPIAGAPSSAPWPVLVMLSKRQGCEELSVLSYARAFGLTAAESRVLIALCRGAEPDAAASQLGVAMSTIRTQIARIRSKTGARSIRAVLQHVALWPPMMGVLGRRHECLGSYYRC